MTVASDSAGIITQQLWILIGEVATHRAAASSTRAWSRQFSCRQAAPRPRPSRPRSRPRPPPRSTCRTRPPAARPSTCPRRWGPPCTRSPPPTRCPPGWSLQQIKYEGREGEDIRRSWWCRNLVTTPSSFPTLHTLKMEIEKILPTPKVNTHSEDQYSTMSLCRCEMYFFVVTDQKKWMCGQRH